MLVGTNFIIYYFLFLFLFFVENLFCHPCVLISFLLILLFKPICCALVTYTKEHKITQISVTIAGGYRLIIPFS